MDGARVGGGRVRVVVCTALLATLVGGAVACSSGGEDEAKPGVGVTTTTGEESASDVPFAVGLTEASDRLAEAPTDDLCAVYDTLAEASAPPGTPEEVAAAVAYYLRFFDAVAAAVPDDLQVAAAVLTAAADRFAADAAEDPDPANVLVPGGPPVAFDTPEAEAALERIRTHVATTCGEPE